METTGTTAPPGDAVGGRRGAVVLDLADVPDGPPAAIRARAADLRRRLAPGGSLLLTHRTTGRPGYAVRVPPAAPLLAALARAGFVVVDAPPAVTEADPALRHWSVLLERR